MSEESEVIRLKKGDLGMLEVAAEERLKTWKLTREYWELLEDGDDRPIVDGEIEECDSLYEAEGMVEMWEEVLGRLRRG